MSESNYKLRKKIKELEEEVRVLRDYKRVMRNIFDKLVACKDGDYYSPIVIIGWMRDLLK